TREYDSSVVSTEPVVRYLPPEEMASMRSSVGLSSATTTYDRYWYFFASRPTQNLFGKTLAFESFGNPQSIYEASSGEMPSDTRHIQLADFNGDSLTDLLYRVPSVANGQTWRLRLNTGVGFSATSSDATGITNPEFAQVADVNGDGRADLLYPPSGNTCGAGDMWDSNRPFCVRYGQAGSTSLAATKHVPGRGARATSQPYDYEHFFADFDGDGAADYVRFKRVGGSSDLFTSRSSTRHQARDVIAQITDGLGATTLIDYEPLTNASVYRRDTGALVGAPI